MEGLLGFVHSPAAPIVRPSLIYASKPKKNIRLNAKLNGENDPFLHAATNAASLRFQEMHRPGKPFLFSLCPCLIFFSARHFIEHLTKNRSQKFQQVKLMLECKTVLKTQNKLVWAFSFDYNASAHVHTSYILMRMSVRALMFECICVLCSRSFLRSNSIT